MHGPVYEFFKDQGSLVAGVLTPVLGIASSAAFLGEQVDSALLVAATIIIAGIAIGTFRRAS